ncbi:MAG TPA: type II toxin-antitoxin system VapC family toxin [Caulobacteraceae bacterium]
MFLLDTNVVSEPAQAVSNPRVIAWIARQNPESLYISAITVAEVEQGIAAMQPSHRRRRLEAWRDEMLESMEDRIVQVDTVIGQTWGRLRARLAASGASIEPLDGFLAATAEAAGLTLVTRNVKHFTAWGGPLLNPWTDG